MGVFDNQEDETYIFNAFFEGMLDGALMVNEKGVISDVNGKMLKMSGYSEKEMISRNILDFTPPGKAREALGLLFELNPSRRKAVIETAIATNHDTVLPVEMECHYLSRGETGPVLVTCRDITHSAEIAAIIESREERYRYVMRFGRDSILEISAHGEIYDVSEAYLRLSGYSREDILRTNYFDLLIGGQSSSERSTLEEHTLFNNFHIAKNGDILPVRVKIVPMRNSVDRMLIFISSTHELFHFIKILREKEQSIQRLKKETKNMEKVIEAIKDKAANGVIVTKVGGGIIYKDDNFLNLLGYSRDEMSKIYYSGFMHPEDLAGSMQDYSLLVSGEKKRHETKWRFVRKDESVFRAEISIERQKDGDDGILLVTYLGNMEELNEKIKLNGRPDFAKLLKELAHEESSAIMIGKPGVGFIYATKGCYEAFGYEKNEMEKLQANELFHPDSMAAAVQNITAVFKGETPEAVTSDLLLKKDGSVVRADTTVKKFQEYMVYLFENIEDHAAVNA